MNCFDMPFNYSPVSGGKITFRALLVSVFLFVPGSDVFAEITTPTTGIAAIRAFEIFGLFMNIRDMLFQ